MDTTRGKMLLSSETPIWPTGFSASGRSTRSVSRPGATRGRSTSACRPAAFRRDCFWEMGGIVEGRGSWGRKGLCGSSPLPCSDLHARLPPSPATTGPHGEPHWRLRRGRAPLHAAGLRGHPRQRPAALELRGEAVLRRSLCHAVREFL